MIEATLGQQPLKGKNIIICCDGTGNKFIDAPDSEDSNSNVVKFYTALKIDNNQVGYYHPGVGTAGDPTAKRWLSRKWSVLKGLAFANGFKDNVLDAYEYLMETFDDGDRVYFLGFSRGSYTVRALAGLLDGYGLLCKGNEGHLPYAWNEYVKQHADRKRHRVKPNTRFKETFSRKGFRVHFMGIWDTVSSVGWITTPLRLYSVAQNPTIRTGRHAISIDERRCFYRDNLWLEANEGQLAELATATHPEPSQDLLQLWFAGVHSDIGGSYPQRESVLSNNALRWLMDEAAKAGAVMKPEMRAMVLGEEVPLTGDPGTDEKINALQPLYEKPTDSKLHNSLHGIWWFLELLPHRYYDKDDGEENWRTPLGMWRRIREGSLIHHSVKQRLEQPHLQYNPKSLRGGLAALKAIDIPSQAPETVYRYEPAVDPKPWLNGAFVRIGLMLLITTLEIALVLFVLGVIIWWFFFHRR